MHLLEAYSVVSGAKIDRCFIDEEPIDLPSKPFITLHSHNPKGSGRQYLYWDDVIKTIIAAIGSKYEIIQIGGANDTKTIANTQYLGKTNYNSLAYLIKHSSLHLGFDSLPVHLASYYDKKMVVLYAHYANSTKPYFSTESNIVLLQPDFSKNKPVFAQTDPFDHINTIHSQDISRAVLNLINN